MDQLSVRIHVTSFAVFATLLLGSSGLAADPFRELIVPFVKANCAECHNARLAEAELNLVRYESAEMAADDFRQWEHVITFVEREEMPPKTAKQQPTAGVVLSHVGQRVTGLLVRRNRSIQARCQTKGIDSGVTIARHHWD